MTDLAIAVLKENATAAEGQMLALCVDPRDILDLISRFEKAEAERDSAETKLAGAKVAANHLRSLLARAEEALRGLDAQNDALCAERTSEIYLTMIDAGSEETLLALDEARRTARTIAREIEEVIHG